MDLSPYSLIQAYCDGFFPMAESADGDIYWHSPAARAIIPLSNVSIPRSMKQLLRRSEFEFTINQDFDYVIRKCGDRDDTWISKEIIIAYNELHRLGYAHSVEAIKDGQIVGGLYGVALGGAFFGESIFNDVPNSGKAAFYILVLHLLRQEFVLLDSQYINDFTRSLGAIEIPRNAYLERLDAALEMNCSFL